MTEQTTEMHNAISDDGATASPTPSESAPTMPPHRVKITFDGYGPYAELICPDGGKHCLTASTEDGPPAPGCWVQSWDNTLDYLKGTLSVPVEITWEGDGPLISFNGNYDVTVEPVEVEVSS